MTSAGEAKAAAAAAAVPDKMTHTALIEVLASQAAVPAALNTD